MARKIPSVTREARRALRAGIVRLVLVGLVAVGIAIMLLALPPVRGRLARHAVSRLHLPNGQRLTVGRIAWPDPGHLQVWGVLWTSAHDTALACARIDLRVSLPALLRGDLHAHGLTIEGLRADVPVLSRMVRPDGTPTRSRFPRQGSFASVPSVGVDDFSLGIERLRLTDSLNVDEASFVGAFDNRRGFPIRFTLRQFRVRAGRPSLDSDGAVEVDVAAGVYRGSVFVDLKSWRFTLDAHATEGDSILLALTHGGESGEPWGMWVRCALETRGEAFAGLKFRGHAWLPSSAEIASSTGGDPTPLLPNLPRTRLQLDGAVRWEGGAASHLTLEAVPNGVVQAAAVRLFVRGSSVSLDTLALLLPGLRLDARGTLMDSTVHGRGTLRVADGAETGAWCALRVLEGLRTATLMVDVDGPRAAPAVMGALSAAGMLGTIPIDSIRVDLSSPAVPVAPAAFSLRGSVAGQALVASGTARIQGDLARVELQPVRFGFTGHEPPDGQGIVTVDLRDGSVRLSDLRVVNDWGMLSCSGGVGPGTGDAVKAHVEWPAIPKVPQAIRGLDEEVLRQLAASWHKAGPFFLDVQATLARDPSVGHTVVGSTRLPGPAQFAPLAPQARLVGLGPVEGTFAARIDSSARVDAAVRLHAPGWMDSAVAHVRIRDGVTSIDSFDLGLFLGHLAGSGMVGPAGSSVTVRYDLDDLGALRSVLPSIPADLGGSLEVEAHYAADATSRRLEARAGAAVIASGVHLPRGEAEIRWGSDSLIVDVRAPDGVRSSAFELRRVAARYAALAGGSPGTLALAAEGDVGARSRIGLAIGRGEWRAVVDSLELWLPDGGMTSVSPFVVAYRPASMTLAVSRLVLRGSLGSLEADGTLSPDGSRFGALLAASVPAREDLPRIPPLLRGATVEASLSCTGRDSVEARWWIEGLAVPGTGAQGSIRAGPSGIRADLTGRQTGRDVVTGLVSTPLRVNVWPPALVWVDEPIQGLVRVDSLIVPLSDPRISPARVALANGSLSLEGSLGAPRAAVHAAVELPRGKKEPARIIGLEGAARPVRRVRRESDAGREASIDSLTLQVHVTSARDTILTASAGTTILFSASPFLLMLPDDATLEVALDAPRFPLDAVNPSLPARTELTGVLAARVGARGPVANPAVQGAFTARQAGVRLTDGSRAVADIRLSLEGTAVAPRIRGAIGVLNGVVVLPENPQAVHDVEGDAMVWAIHPPGHGPLPPAPPHARGTPTRRRVPAFAPDLDVELRVPGGLWVRGQGLNVEVAGDVQATCRPAPVLTGTMRIVQGRFDYLGRSFRLRQGSLVFYGNDPPDPVLDLVADAKVADVTFTITLKGTLRAPALALDADPWMPEADIVSYLLLGRPVDRLDSGQLDLVRERLTEIASMRGADELQAAVSKALGLDLIEVGEGRAGSAEALVVGKYLGPRLLIGYERGLARGSHTYVTLEYLVSEFLRLKTWTGQSGDSSAEVSFVKDY